MKKTFLLLAILLILITVAACNDDKPQNTPVSTQGSESTAETVEEYTGPYPDLPEKTFPNAEMNFLTYDGNYFDIDLYNSESNGDVLQDAIIERNLAIEEKYGIDIVMHQIPFANCYNEVYNLSAAGSLPYQALVVGFDQTYKMAASDLLLDLESEVPYINLDNPWWDQGTRNDCSINHKLYYVANSMTLKAHETTWIAMFNKKMLSDTGLDENDIYEYVKNGTWTLDKYTEITRQFIKDLNQDGYMNTADSYGTAYQGSGPDGFLIGAGLRYITKDEDDRLIFQELDDRSLDILNKVYNICNNAFNSHYDGDNDKINTESEYGRTLFIENRALFFTESIGSAQAFRDMEADFGMVPLPKYDQKTEKYTSFMHGLGTVISVPTQCSDIEMTGIILEDMAFMSYKDVEPIYFGLAIEGKYVRDTASMEMVEYIIQNRVIDLGLVNNAGSVSSNIRNMINTGTPAFASTYKRSLRSAKQDVEALNEQFE